MLQEIRTGLIDLHTYLLILSLNLWLSLKTTQTQLKKKNNRYHLFMSYLRKIIQVAKCEDLYADNYIFIYSWFKRKLIRIFF